MTSTNHNEGTVSGFVHSIISIPLTVSLGYEYKDGTAVPFDRQHKTYKTVCNIPDPDGDGENECYNHIPAFMLAPNYETLEAIGETYE